MRILAIFIILALSLNSISYILYPSSVAFAQQPTAEERAQLEKELAELEKEIAQEEAKLVQISKQKVTLQSEVRSLNTKIDRLNLKIRHISLSLSKLDGEIAVTQKDIQKTQTKLDVNKDALTKLIRRLYESDRLGLTAILLKSSKLSDFVGDVNNLI